jgi:carboxylate-amine ligase
VAAAILLRVSVRTVGVEEEFLLVDPETGRPRAVGNVALAATDSDEDELTGELHREQLETGTKPCHTLDQLGAELRSARATAVGAARDVGVALAALATSPLPVEPTVSPSPRYEEMARRFGRTASEQLTCGCHVHVAIESAEEGVAALDRIRPWLAPLIAVSANSPFWLGEDSGYASYRSQVWQRWPSAGPYGPFGSVAAYRQFVDSVLATGTVLRGRRVPGTRRRRAGRSAHARARPDRDTSVADGRGARPCAHRGAAARRMARRALRDGGRPARPGNLATRSRR